MNKPKDIKDMLKLIETFLTDGRSFCFQAQSQCDYFNISLSPQPGGVRKNTQYYHATSLEEIVVKTKYMIENSKDPEDVKPKKAKAVKPAMPTPPGFPAP